MLCRARFLAPCLAQHSHRTASVEARAARGGWGRLFDLESLLSHGFVSGRRVALDIASHALEAVDPYRAVLRHVEVRGGRLTIDDDAFELARFERIYIVGGGKACYPQAVAVEQLLADHITDGFISVKRGQLAPFMERMGRLKRIRVAESAHPVPDAASLQAGREILAIAGRVTEADLLICLTSGGTSAQVIAPVEGISMADKALVNHLMVNSGADITEIMTVRGHLSRIKNGQLAAQLRGATAITLAVSDEKTDSLMWNTDWMSPNGTSPADAVRIAQAYGVWKHMPESVRRYLSSHRVSAPPPATTPLVHRYMVVKTRELFDAAAGRAAELGLRPLPLTSVLSGESREAGRVLAAVAREVARSGQPVAPPCALIATGETSVRLTNAGAGEGGPNQELAAGACLELEADGNIAVLALDTDGSDGPTDIAGALTDGTTPLRATRAGVDLPACLNEHNVSRALRAAGDAVITGPTGTNVNDLVVMVVLPDEA